MRDEEVGWFILQTILLAITYFSPPPPILSPPFTYQRLGFIFIFEIVELVPLEDKPARVPGLDKAALLPQPPTLDGNVPALAQGRSL